MTQPQPCPRRGCLAEPIVHKAEQPGFADNWWAKPNGPPEACMRYRETGVMCQSGVKLTRDEAVQGWQEAVTAE